MKIQLTNKKIHSDDIVTLFFTPPEKVHFEAGQYTYIQIGGQEKPYSISSSPDEEMLGYTIKKTGAFSTLLYSLNIGDTIEIKEPEGQFILPDREQIVMIAGGIGIAPFHSMLQTKQHLTLFYSVKYIQDAVFLDEFEKLEKEGSLKLVLATTQEKNERAEEFERYTLDTLKKYTKDFAKNTFMICGSIDFVDDMWEMLGDAGIPEVQIKTEAFY